MGAFAAHGYVPLEPPMVEYASGAVSFGEGRVLQFLDRDGRLVALRPDMTTAVARLVAQRYRDLSGALRLAYFTPVFREEPAMQGAEREYDQAGVELIGPSGLLADAEVLALLADALARCEVGAFTIEVGHAGVARGLFADLPDEAAAGALDRLRAGDHVGALTCARDAGMESASLERARAVLGARGALDGLDATGIADLRDLVALASELSPSTSFVANLALLPELPYYTGAVFEAVSPHVGFPLAQGGRYDRLLAAFGAPHPATGFAINVPRLHLARFSEGRPDVRGGVLLSLAADGDARTVLRTAAALRSAGLAVAIGDVAEPAGQRVLSASVVAGGRVRLADGRVLSAGEAARELAR